MYTNRVFGTEKFVPFIDTRGVLISGCPEPIHSVACVTVEHKIRTHFAAANTTPEIRTPH